MDCWGHGAAPGCLGEGPSRARARGRPGWTWPGGPRKTIPPCRSRCTAWRLPRPGRGGREGRQRSSATAGTGGHGQAHVLRHRPEAVPEAPERHRGSLPRGVRPSLSGVDADRGQLPFRPGCADRDRRGRGAPDMKRWEHFDYDEHEGVATLTFSRPERLNALTFDVYADIRDLTDSLRRRQDIRVLVIRGQGRGFCSGGDVD